MWVCTSGMIGGGLGQLHPQTVAVACAPSQSPALTPNEYGAPPLAHSISVSPSSRLSRECQEHVTYSVCLSLFLTELAAPADETVGTDGNLLREADSARGPGWTRREEGRVVSPACRPGLGHRRARPARGSSLLPCIRQQSVPLRTRYTLPFHHNIFL